MNHISFRPCKVTSKGTLGWFARAILSLFLLIRTSLVIRGDQRIYQTQNRSESGSMPLSECIVNLAWLYTKHTISSSASANEVVYFMVTNIEHDVVAADTDTTDDIFVRCIMGEYGCWVDTLVTRMAQVGVEHSRVPDTGSSSPNSECSSFGYTLIGPRPSYLQLNVRGRPFQGDPRSSFSLLRPP